MVKISDAQRLVLEQGAPCFPNTGFLFHGSGHSMRVISACVKKGWVEIWQGGPIKVIIITTAGRKTLKESEDKPRPRREP